MNEELADAIMESMPPVPWPEIATTRDLTALETRVGARFDQVDARLDQMDTRFDQMERYISNELVGLEGRLSMRFTEAVRLVVVSTVLLFAGILGLASTYLAAGA